MCVLILRKLVFILIKASTSFADGLKLVFPVNHNHELYYLLHSIVSSLSKESHMLRKMILNSNPVLIFEIFGMNIVGLNSQETRILAFNT